VCFAACATPIRIHYPHRRLRLHLRYATLGELVAWIIGWDLCLEYAFGASTVASGWGRLLQQPASAVSYLSATTNHSDYRTTLVFYHEQWTQLMSLPPGISDAGLPHATGVVNLIAVAIVMVITTILVIGIKESANFNSAVVIIKVTIVGIFLVIGGWFLFTHPEVAKLNWHPFVPPPDGHGNFGWGGIPKAAASIFFAYIGFDAVSTAAQEAKNPKRDMPIGILGSFVVCTVLYILVSLVLTGLVSYKTLNVSAPVALQSTQRAWAGFDPGEDWRCLRPGHRYASSCSSAKPVSVYSMSEGWVASKWASSRASEVQDTLDHYDRLWRLCRDHACLLQYRRALGTAGQHRHAAGPSQSSRGVGSCVCGIQIWSGPSRRRWFPLVPILGMLSAST